MSEKNLDSAVAYYQAMARKDLSTLKNYLHPHVQLIGPMATVTGKEAVLSAVGNFISIFNKLTVRAQCSRGDQVMLAYDLDCPAPFGVIRGAVLLTFADDLIKGYELFYDARPFESKKEEIFAEASS